MINDDINKNDHLGRQLNNFPLMVTIRCITYNHEPYIRQCLEGFVMQKTNFRFEAIVHDDASTDGTATVIREYAEKYPDIIKPIYETENQYSKHDGSLQRIMSAHMRGKYIAVCEGDDYWIDPFKLQKQVDFLEANPEYGLVFGKVKLYIQKSECYAKREFGKEISCVKSLFRTNTVPTPTVLYRKELYDRYQKNVDVSGWLLGDYPLWLYISLHSNIHFVNKPLAVYRVLADSASHSTSIEKRERFIHSVFEMKHFFNEKYHIVDETALKDLLNEALLSNAFSFNAHDKVIEYYEKIGGKCSWKTYVKYLIAKYRLPYRR